MNGFEGLMLARVVRFHPLDRSCDCQLVYDGSRLTAVPVLAGMIGSSSGLMDLHEPEGVDWDGPSAGTRDVMAVLGEINGQPLVMGFIAPSVSQMLFDRPNFRVDRHASDVYSTIDKEGNVEIAHPSGTFLRIATSPEHENLTGQDFDKRWKITRNTAKAPWVSLTVASSGVVKASLRISPTGNVTLNHAGSLTVSTAGAATLSAASFEINGPVAINGPSLTHNGINVGDSHAHSGVRSGPSASGGPV
jgi:hypothetical protein